MRDPDTLQLPPLLGHADREAQEALARKLVAARAWMREHGIMELNRPIVDNGDSNEHSSTDRR